MFQIKINFFNVFTNHKFHMLQNRIIKACIHLLFFIFFHRMIALLWSSKMLFILFISFNFFSFSWYSNFCIFALPSFFLSAIALQDDQRYYLEGNPNFQGILNWILQLIMLYSCSNCSKQQKNIKNLQFIEQNTVIFFCHSLCLPRLVLSLPFINITSDHLSIYTILYLQL